MREWRRTGDESVEEDSRRDWYDNFSRYMWTGEGGRTERDDIKKRVENV